MLSVTQISWLAEMNLHKGTDGRVERETRADSEFYHPKIEIFGNPALLTYLKKEKSSQIMTDTNGIKEQFTTNTHSDMKQLQHLRYAELQNHSSDMQCKTLR